MEIIQEGNKVGIWDEMTSSPCRSCKYFESNIERKICREYDDCRLNAEPKETAVETSSTAQKNTPEPKPEPKVIEKIKCKECGDFWPHTKDFFSSNRYGLMKICKACMKKKQAARRSVNKPRKPSKKPSPPEAKIQKESPAMENPNKRHRKKINERRIEFGNENADLMADFERYAKEDFRTFRQQVVFVLSKYRNERESDGQNQA